MDSALEVAMPAEFGRHAVQAAQFLKLLANEHRLLVLCHLLTSGESSVNALVGQLGLRQSALSQHLAMLREDELVTFRRESQTLFYRVSDPRAARILAVLRDLFRPAMSSKKEIRQ